MNAHENAHEKINYVEFAAADLAATKHFFGEVFGWEFEDYGEQYIAFSKATAGLDGGFYQASLASSTVTGGALIVLYSNDLAATQAKIEKTGGSIIKPTFAFPGGRRFHFSDPNGNEFAVWSDG